MGAIADKLKQRRSLSQNKERTGNNKLVLSDFVTKEKKHGRKTPPSVPSPIAFGDRAEVKRVISLPVIEDWLPETHAKELDEMSKRLFLAEAYAAGKRLFHTQANAFRRFEIAYEQGQGGFFPIGVGWGKCTSGDTEFWDVSTGRRRADDEGPARVPSVDTESGSITNKDASVFSSGKKECLRMELKSGQVLEASRDHPVLTGRGWVKVEDLKRTDLVATPRTLPEPPKAHREDDDVVIFLAYLMSDGSTARSQPDFTSLDGETWRELEDVVKCLGGSIGFETTSGKALTKGIRGLTPLLRSLGQMGCKSVNKRLPASWYNLPKDQCLLFLSRFIACDGHLDIKTPKIEITLANRLLVEDLRHLFLRIGIHVNVFPKKTLLNGKMFDAWRLNVTGEQLCNFVALFDEYAEDIPGRDYELEQLRHYQHGNNTNTDVVPISRPQVYEIFEEMENPRRTEIRNFLGATAGQWVSRAKFSAFVEKYGYQGKYTWLATSDIKWSKIREITNTGFQEVFDLNVPGTETWIGSGIVIHNTGLSLMISNYVYTHPTNPKKVIMLCIPPRLAKQLVDTDIGEWRKTTPIQYPIKVLAGRPAAERLRKAKTRAPGLYIVSYSQLSSPDAEDLLHALDPEVIVLDEADNVAEKGNSARSKRFYRFLQRAHPVVAAMSGTLTQKTPMEYQRLSTHCLGHLNFMPNSVPLAAEWASMMDAESTKDGDSVFYGKSVAPALPLLNWAESRMDMHLDYTPTGLRKAFQARMVTSPGVYSSGDAKIGTELWLRQSRIAKEDAEYFSGWDRVQALKEQVEVEYKTPNGDEIEHAIHKFKWLSEICGAGFYNELLWPEPKKLAARKNITVVEAESILDKARDHHSAGQEYASLLRDFLQKRSFKGCDTPMLVGREFHIHGIDGQIYEPELFQAWSTWKDLDFEGRPEREPRAVFLCDFKIVEMLKIVAEWEYGTGGIVWYENIAVGNWAYQYAKDAGFDCIHCPSGSASDEIITDRANKNKIVIASLRGHGVGKNLQHFHNQVFLQWPRSAKQAEQVLGREHRNGQEKASITAQTIVCDIWDDLNFAATLNDALYIHQSMGTGQKLIYAKYDPTPKIFPSHVLDERGAETMASLGAEHKELIHKKFGGFSKL